MIDRLVKFFKYLVLNLISMRCEFLVNSFQEGFFLFHFFVKFISVDLNLWEYGLIDGFDRLFQLHECTFGEIG